MTMATRSHDHGHRPNASSTPVRGRYQAYKAGTEGFLRWLVTKADACCGPATIVKSIRDRPATTPRAANQSRITVRTHEMVTLAEVVAENSDSCGVISEDMLKVLQRVIAGRSACANWYSSQKGGDDLQIKNQGHRFYVEVSCTILISPPKLNLARRPSSVCSRFSPQRVPNHRLASYRRRRMSVRRPARSRSPNRKMQTTLLAVCSCACKSKSPDSPPKTRNLARRLVLQCPQRRISISRR